MQRRYSRAIEQLECSGNAVEGTVGIQQGCSGDTAGIQTVCSKDTAEDTEGIQQVYNTCAANI